MIVLWTGSPDLTSILIQLQSKKVIVAKEIAQRFDISLRTVYRDIRTLQEAGVPIGSENGKGYFLVSGYHLPPVMFTEQEANTLVIAEKLIENQGDTSLQKDFASLLFKIKSVLHEHQKEDVEKLEQRVSPSYLKVPAESDSLSDLKSAITKNIKVKITYHSKYKDEITTRVIDPLGVYFSQTAWVLIAFCNTRNDYREFRLDRIQAYRITQDVFEHITEFDIIQYFIQKYHP